MREYYVTCLASIHYLIVFKHKLARCHSDITRDNSNTVISENKLIEQTIRDRLSDVSINWVLALKISNVVDKDRLDDIATIVSEELQKFPDRQNAKDRRAYPINGRKCHQLLKLHFSRNARLW